MKRKHRKSKQAIWSIIGTIAFALLGLACLFVGYGLRDGWDSVIAWFSSKYAIYLYIGLVIYVCLAIGFLLFVRRRRY